MSNTEVWTSMIPEEPLTLLPFLQAGIALGELRSVGDLYDFHSIATLFLIGVVSVTPTMISKNNS